MLPIGRCSGRSCHGGPRAAIARDSCLFSADSGHTRRPSQREKRPLATAACRADHGQSGRTRARWRLQCYRTASQRPLRARRGSVHHPAPASRRYQAQVSRRRQRAPGSRRRARRAPPQAIATP
ncbi:hypothetical protein BIWAKO_04115 [Bosea sp. BIWAKO-01]|nr:hypothetical protein BIWAKO_04115 [Bosea sp. BIWAKO-01]